MFHSFGEAKSKNAVKNANIDAPACVSKVSSGSIDRSMMQRKTVYRKVRFFLSENQGNSKATRNSSKPTAPKAIIMLRYWL